MVIVYGYAKCSTVKKSLKFLNDNKIEYKHIDNVENRLTSKELRNIYEKSGIENIKKLFNSSGMKYRELNLKEKLKEMNLEECFKILSTDGMLVKRPILVNDKEVLIGFKEDMWKKKLLNKKFN